MKVAVVGTRGIPDVYGGVERHCEELYPRIAKAGHEVCVYARQSYVPESRVYKGVRVEVVPSPRGRGLEAFAHTAAAMRQAARDGCDVLHIHSVGPCALIPYARALGHRRVVTTLHAPDYRQRKWGAVARTYLRLGERLGVLGADATICVAHWYAQELAEKYRHRVVTIPNGPGLTGGVARERSPFLDGLGLGAGYVLFVGRLVPDKRVEDLIAAARLAGDLPVVIAGDESDSRGYSQSLHDLASDSVTFPGYVYGQDLVDLYSQAALFVLPSAVEGLPISALEAMSFRVPVVMSDIPANRELADDGRTAVLYPCGDVQALKDALLEAIEPAVRLRLVNAASAMVHDRYDWDLIAAETLEVYARMGPDVS